MQEASYFVGIGAQRSGTTWIGHFLRGLPDVRLSPIKEVCYFDSKFLPERHLKLRNRINTKLAVLGLGNFTSRHPVSGAILAFHYLGIRRLKDASYGHFFAELARSGRLSGEISPSYSALGEDAIRCVEYLLNRPKYIYIMRNPVDRLISEYSFRTNRKGMSPIQHGSDLADTLLMLLAESKHSAYDACVAQYEKVIDPARIHLMFTEDLFSPDKYQTVCDRLCEFLGVPGATATVGYEANRSPGVELPLELRRTLVQKLLPQYEFAINRFGGCVPDRWARDLDLLHTP